MPYSKYVVPVDTHTESAMTFASRANQLKLFQLNAPATELKKRTMTESVVLGTVCHAEVRN
jgi:hypothetical protein